MALRKICMDITDYTDEGEAENAPGEEEGISVLVLGDEEATIEETNFVLDDEECEDDMNIVQEPEEHDRVAKKEFIDEEDDLDPNIDAYWLQRELTKFFDDVHQTQKMAGEVMEILENDS